MSAHAGRLVVLSEEDPVAQGVGEALGPGRTTGERVGGAFVYDLGDGLFLLKRPGLHIHDETLGPELADLLPWSPEAVIFPSVHRSESGRACLTAHPLGNLGSEATLGGQPRRLVPVPARLLSATLLALSEASSRVGLPATFEATHHGPGLDLPAFFVEAGASSEVWKDARIHREIAAVVRALTPEPLREDPIVIGVGGGHYAPRFGDLVRLRHLAVGHMVPRHQEGGLDGALWAELVRATPGVSGVLFASAPSPLSAPPPRSLPVLPERALALRASPGNGPAGGSSAPGKGLTP
jgi:D-aminoacyl-tRNA deacylase